MLKKVRMAEDEQFAVCHLIPQRYITLHHLPSQFLKLFFFYRLSSALCYVLKEEHHWTSIAGFSQTCFKGVLNGL